MIYPNIECYYLCVWMLTISSQRLTGSQITVTQNIQAAALAQTGVTENEWQNFNEYAAWRNPYYLVYRDYAIANTTSLNTGLTNYYDFEGNSNDLVGSLNGTDTAVSYSNTYGRIGQGVRNNGTSSWIIFGGVSDFSYIQNTGVFAYNIWMRPSASGSNYRVLGNANTASLKGFHSLFTTGQFFQHIFYNGSAGASYPYYSINLSNFLVNQWQMYTVTGDGTYVYVYLNAVCISKVQIWTLSTGDSSNALYLFNLIGISGSATIDFDELGFWNRALNFAEIVQLYNNGSGITYPF